MGQNYGYSQKVRVRLHILVCVLGLKLGVRFGLELALVIRLGFCSQLGSRLDLGQIFIQDEDEGQSLGFGLRFWLGLVLGLGFDELYRQTVMENSLAKGTQVPSSHWSYERDKSNQPNIFFIPHQIASKRNTKDSDI